MKIELLYPLSKPYAVTQHFGENPQRYRFFGLPGHEGIDWGAPLGASVMACHAGKVETTSATGAYGNHIRIRYDGDPAQGCYQTTYAHLSRIRVETGQRVQAGEVIGLVGSTGNSSGPHLHLMLKIDGRQTPGYPPGIVDPEPYVVNSFSPVELESGGREAGSSASNPEARSAALFKVRVICDELIVRAGPGREYPAVDRIFRGDQEAVAAICSGEPDSDQEIWLKIGPGRFIALVYRGEILAAVMK
jgi:hypothetical protein